jgi:putative intracellular protease/amidase
MKIKILFFDGFEALDVFGPVEVFSKAEVDPNELLLI